jgi:hypothetical protein
MAPPPASAEANQASAAVAATSAGPAAPVPQAAARITGEVVYLYAFDVAYEMARKPVVSLLGQPAAEFAVYSSKRSPRQLFFYRPQMVRLPPLERLTARGPVRVERSVKLLPVGAVSITVRVPFAVGQLLRSEQNHRWMMLLEVSIVVLFVIDLLILAAGMKK